MDYFRNQDHQPLEFDEEGIISEYQKNDSNTSLAIKILSIFGGILASLSFLGFLFITRIYESYSALLIVGGIFILASLWINKHYGKIIMDTFSISCFMIGFLLIGFGCSQLDIHVNLICILFILIALATLLLVQTYILSFISVLIISGSILTLIISNQYDDLIHIYVAVLALILAFITLKEARIITSSKALSKLYNPVRTGLIFSFLSGLIALSIKDILPLTPDYLWTSSVVIMAIIVFLISRLFKIWDLKETRYQLSIYLLTVVALVPTALSPAISGSILLILLSFMVNHKTGLALGILGFVFFISQFYYDLNFTLLTKSILLFSTGLVFLAIYLFIQKTLTKNEKL